MDPATDWVVNGGRYALDFDGGNDNVEIAAINRLAVNINNGLFTVSFWARVESAISGGLCSLASSANVLRWNINSVPLNLSGGQVPTGGILISRAGVAIGGSTVVFPVGAFVHILASFTATSHTLYLNGFSSPIVGGMPNTGTITRIFLGSSASGGAASSFGQCQLDDFRIYTRPIAPDDARQLWQLGRGNMPMVRKRRYTEEAAAATNRRRRLICGSVC